MPKRHIIIGTIIACLSGYCCFAATHYVVTNGTPGVTPSNPYTNWATAGTNIIDVVNAASTNTVPRMVWVSNGTYYLTNQVTISSAITVTSVNGREITIVDGNNYAGKPVTNRCFELSASGAVLDGFTITNGCRVGVVADDPGGGGVKTVAGTTVKNCRITGCVVTNTDGIIAYGGGASIYGVITNCEVIRNINYCRVGGGIYLGAGAVADCVIASNILPTVVGETQGGGIYAEANTVISDCVINGNVNTSSASSTAGAGVCFRGGAILRNSLICNNQSGKYWGGAVMIYASWAIVDSCTIVSNANIGGQSAGLHILTDTTKTSYIENVVSYFNSGGSSGSNVYINNAYSTAYTGSCHIVNSCIAPTNFTTALSGYYYANNIQVNPQFAGKDTGDFRLAQGSPCINSGTNETWMNGFIDLDGHSRIDRFSGIVDMGCYEYLPAGTICTVP